MTKNRSRVLSHERRNFLKAAGSASAAGLAAVAADLGHAQVSPSERKMPAQWDESTDVLVVGSGFAGCAAAASAAEGGSKVIVLEKMPAIGGNSAINLGDFASWDSKLQLRQKLKLGEDSAEQHARDALTAGEGYNDPALVSVMTANAPAALDWMVERGDLKLRDILHRQGLSAYRMHYGPSGRGLDYVEALRRIAEKHGTQIRLEHKVSWLWRNGKAGPVLGLEVQTARGTRNIRARRGVIIASGGFGADINMRQAYRPILTATYNCTNHRGATGEMIRLAQAAGADALHLAFIEIHPYGEPDSGALDTATSYALQIRRNGSMLVGKNGKRFVNEFAPHDFVSRQEVATGAKPTFTIFNEAMLAKGDEARNQIEVPKLLQQGRFKRSETLLGLAEQTGIDAGALEETVRRYSGFLKEGKDPDFNRPMAKDAPSLDAGPYYAIPNWPSVHHTMGGLRIDAQARVIDIWGQAIPRLYAAGEVTGGIHGAARVGGNSSADPVVFGRIAGMQAARATPG